MIRLNRLLPLLILISIGVLCAPATTCPPREDGMTYTWEDLDADGIPEYTAITEEQRERGPDESAAGGSCAFGGAGGIALISPTPGSFVMPGDKVTIRVIAFNNSNCYDSVAGLSWVEPEPTDLDTPCESGLMEFLLGTTIPPNDLVFVDRTFTVEESDAGVGESIIVGACITQSQQSPGGTIWVGTFDPTFPVGLLTMTSIFDFDHNGETTARELASADGLSYLLDQWGTDDVVADLNDDGSVGPADLALLLGAWPADNEAAAAMSCPPNEVPRRRFVDRHCNSHYFVSELEEQVVMISHDACEAQGGPCATNHEYYINVWRCDDTNFDVRPTDDIDCVNISKTFCDELLREGGWAGTDHDVCDGYIECDIDPCITAGGD